MSRSTETQASWFGPIRRIQLAGLVLAAFTIWMLVGTARQARADKASEEIRQQQEQIEESIDRGLAYLERNQAKDGSFKSGMGRNTGITSLCVMAFLSRGYTPGTGPYGDVINRSIDFVLDSQNKNGMIVSEPSHGPMYSHCISTLMLSEVSGMVDPNRQVRIDEVLSKAVGVILSAQNVKKSSSHAGGWRYQHTSNDSDISCTGWALMALRSARGNGAPVPEKAIERAVRYVKICRSRDGGFSYQGKKNQSGLARTGTGLLCLELTGEHDSKVNREAGDWILKHLPRRFGRESHFYYGLYYCSQGMFQLGGQYWSRWADRMFEMVLKYQEDKKKSEHYGSWPAGSGNEGKAGRCYATSMSILAMTVSCRQLPIYQR